MAKRLLVSEMDAATAMTMAEEIYGRSGMIIAIDDAPVVTINLCDEPPYEGPSRAKPPKTFRVPGGGAKECARRLAQLTKQHNVAKGTKP